MHDGGIKHLLIERMLSYVIQQIKPQGGDPEMGQKPSLVIRINADTYDGLMRARQKGEHPWDRLESTSAVIDRLLLTVGNKKTIAKKLQHLPQKHRAKRKRKR